MGNNVSPTFIGIGAQKCATTWLYDLLELHPAVGLSSVKEIHFFSQYYGYGLQWYESHFAHIESDRSVIGEFSTSYFCDYETPKRIKHCYPDSKIVLMLRHPVERLLSNHKHEIRIEHLNGPDFSVEAGIQNNPTYVEQGLYHTHLCRWLEFYDRDQIHIVFYDQLRRDPAAVEQELYEFLGLEQMVHHELLSKSNQSYVYKSRGLEQFRRSLLGLMRSLKLESLYRWIVRKTGLQSAYRKVNRSSPQQLIPTISDNTREQLLQFFSDEVAKLEGLLQVDLSAWKR